MSRTMKTMDGNTAASHVAYAFTDIAAIYPITPSSTMAELVDEWSAFGRENIFGERVLVEEMQSEGGAAGAVHGSLAAGALTTTFTASQGLLLMVPNMYKIAGENLPGVFHVTARAIASHALSIFGDHQDVMATRQTGFALLASGSVQEVMDLGSVAHLAAIKGKVPFLHFFDGFRTSHEVQKIEVMDYEELAKLLDWDALNEFRATANHPNRPKTTGTAENADIYFQGVEASNPFYDNIVGVVDNYIGKINEITGRNYGLFNYYGADDADRVIVAMGSVTEALEEVVDYLNAKGEKVGVLKVHLYRPFSREHFLAAMPKTVKKIAVLDRTKEKGSVGEPLYLDVRTIYFDEENPPVIVGGRYGLGSKDTNPSMLKAVYDNLSADKPRTNFTIGIEDDVTNLSLEVKEQIRAVDDGTIRCKFWGFGSDGTVGANKQAIKIIGDDTDMYAQGYFDYDSKKSGGVTMSHLRFGNNKIRSTYLLDEADFISCSKQSYVHQYELLRGLKEGGIFLLNTIWSEEELDANLPASLKNYIAKHNIEFYTINASKIASEIGLGGRTNMIMQSAFFKLSNVLPIEDAIRHLKDSVVQEYGRKGEKVVSMNHAAIDAGVNATVKINVPEAWATVEDAPTPKEDRPAFIDEVVIPMTRQLGNDLPVSAFKDIANGELPMGTSQYEKRGIAAAVPEWQVDKCIQCNRCAYVCPHAVVRPFLVTEEEKANAPAGFETKKAVGKGLENYEFRIQVSPLDCTGCGNCADVCPSKEKSLIMKPFEEQLEAQKDNWKYAHDVVGYKEDVMGVETLKGTQFKQPLLEFSGACAGCGETAYCKLITQLWGDKMMIANATGCSMIWGASAPSTPYTINKNTGCGPSWANSLFEDNAEFGLGMRLATRSKREQIKNLIEKYSASGKNDDLTKAGAEWIANMDDYAGSKEAGAAVAKALETVATGDDTTITNLKGLTDFLVKRSQWIIGGDGWAYDIGYGGLDHVLASGDNVNVLVLDTEVYSNTGGQSSKATPTAAVAKFAASGKKIRKKDLGLMAVTYGYVYVAQIAMGADMNQTLKAIREAESYDGPSLIIAYAPCINHGISTGMGTSSKQQLKAVETGYWHLYRFDPRLAEEGKNPFQLDSKAPTKPLQEFLDSEVRYTTLKRSFPEEAEILFKAAAEAAEERYESYRKLAEA